LPFLVINAMLATVNPEHLKSQGIPLTPALWRIARSEEFFGARRKLLAQSFNEFVREDLPGRRLRQPTMQLEPEQTLIAS